MYKQLILTIILSSTIIASDNDTTKSLWEESWNGIKNKTIDTVNSFSY